MIKLLGTSTTDKIYNTAIARSYTPEAAAAISATVFVESIGNTLITYRGDRYNKFAAYAEKVRSDPLSVDTQIAFIFDCMKDYNVSKIKYAKTIDDGVRAFNEDYLKKALNKDEFLKLITIANDINRVFVG